jgi:hypothetical protein
MSNCHYIPGTIFLINIKVKHLENAPNTLVKTDGSLIAINGRQFVLYAIKNTERRSKIKDTYNMNFKLDRIGLVLFIVGCFGVLQIALGIDRVPGFGFIAMTVILLGAYLYAFTKDNKNG